MNSSKRWTAFAEEMGELFGPLSSFYWGRRYVVLVQGEDRSIRLPVG